MAIGHTSFHLYTKGRPYQDFEDLLLLQSQNSIDIGQLNHSEEFSRFFLPFCDAEVQKRINLLLSSVLVQIGHPPPLDITADKATYKHRTR